MIVNGSGQVTSGGADLGAYLGANTFYNLGYTGTRATVANIEGGYAWTGHQSLTTSGQIPLQADATDAVLTHPTGVAAVLAGRGNRTLDRGIAYGSALYSGNVGVQFFNTNGRDQYTLSQAAFAQTYLAAISGFVPRNAPADAPPVRADVINSSWAVGTTWNGPTPYTTALDALVSQYGTTVVVAAGNDGPTTNTLTSPAGAYNVITVGGLRSATQPQILANYNSISNTSSRSPTVTRVPSGLFGFRNAISLVAPGENYSVAAYGGPGTVQNFYAFNVAGTSFAAPTVAGAAALLADVGYDRFVTPGNRTALDGRVMRAVLMNSATKLPGWDNGAYLFNGVTYTPLALDATLGAGALNIAQAYAQYTGEGFASPTTGNVLAAGTTATVTPIGWDYDTLSATTPLATYSLSEPLRAGSSFAATLTWFVGGTFDPAGSLGTTTSFANFALDLDYQTPSGAWATVYESDTYLNNVEHIAFTLPATGNYQLRVRYKSPDYGDPVPTDFALAWSGVSAIPEPSVGVLLLAAAPVGLRRRR